MHRRRRLSFQHYYDKVHGGWLGKFIGGTFGGPFEGTKTVMDVRYYDKLPDEAMINDDNDFQLVWLKGLEDVGPYIEASDLTELWMKYIWYPFCEYGYALKNFRRGIFAPASGSLNNAYYAESMGCPVRSEIWAYVSPGNPELAAQYARTDGELDHAGFSVDAEAFFAGLQAEAFFTSEMEKLIDVGLSVLPRDSQMHELVRDVRRWIDGATKWLDVRRSILCKYGSPDMMSAQPNVAFTLLALLWAKGDFARTQFIAINCGFDTDCSCATSAATLGIIKGASGLPGKWKNPIGDHYGVGVAFKRRSNSTQDLVLDTCRMGLLVNNARSRRVTFTGVPKDVKPAAAPSTPREISLATVYDFPKDPTSPDAVSLRTTLTRNHSGAAKYEISLDSRDGKIASKKQKVTLQEGKPHEIAWEFTWKNTLVFPSAASATLSVHRGQGSVLRRKIGIPAPVVWDVYGPYWSPSTEQPKKGTPHAHGGADLPSIEAMTQNEASLQEKYLDEGRFPTIAGVPSARLHAFEDRLSLNQVVPMDGPACLYLSTHVGSPVARDVWAVMGANTCVTVWQGGKVVFRNSEATSYAPYNRVFATRLRKGNNRFIIKLVRHSDTWDFSFGLKPYPKNMHWHRLEWLLDLVSHAPSKRKRASH